MVTIGLEEFDWDEPRGVQIKAKELCGNISELDELGKGCNSNCLKS